MAATASSGPVLPPGVIGEEIPDRTDIFVLPNAVIIARPDHTSIQGHDRTDYGAALNETMRDRLRFFERILPRGRR